MRRALLFWLTASVSALALEPPPPHDLENSRVIKIDTERGWTLDSTGRAWMLLKDSLLSLCEWDGKKWVAHVLPGEISKMDPRAIADAQGRVWVLSGYQNQVLQIFDTRSGQWQSFPNLQAAYLKLRNDPPHFPANDLWVFDPQYNANRVAYRDGVIDLYYYDGSSWQNLRRPQITGKKETDLALGPPWFGPDGKLHVNIRNQTTWRRDDTGKWSQLEFESHFPTDIWSEGQGGGGRPIPPDECVTNHPDSIVVDNLGTFWLSWQGDLYKSIPGRCVKVFGPDEMNPFRSIHDLRKAFVDPRGNAFLLTASARMGVFIIKPKSSPPVTHIVMKRKDEDSYVARLDAHTKQPVTFRWQLDDGPWQLSKAGSLPLDHLPNGSHLLKVTAIDDQLNMDATPATAGFETKIDPDRQMAALMAQLFAPDFSKRELAVDAMAQQPATALPTLHKARETATDDQRWWIDAAIQECERQMTDARAKPTVAPGN